MAKEIVEETRELQRRLRDAHESADRSRTTITELTKLLHHVLHQRTGPMGLKVEDDLLRENEPLLLECLKYTRTL
jgi:hypothetical protein